MKITYVIGPFKSPKYLIRCINSILRQTVKDNEIIVADNRFKKNEELEEFLNTTEGVRLISDEPESEIDKINEALSLADDDSLINIISAGTVASPIASETVADIDADIIAVSHALKMNDTYTVTRIDEFPVIDSGAADIQSLFFKKKLLSDLTPEVISEKIPFELWIDKLLLDGVSQAVSGEICFYFGLERLKHKVDDAECCLQNKAEILEVAGRALKTNTKEGLFLFDKYLSRLYKLLISNKYELSVKSEIFAFIKELGELAKADDFARRIFNLYLGADIESISTMEVEAYLFFAERLIAFGDKPVTRAQMEQVAQDAAAAVEVRLRSTQVKHQRRIKKLEKDVEKLTAENEKYKAEVKDFTKIAADPRKQVPAMFGQGKLGFRVLLRSFKAWLKRKLGIKRK